MGQEETETVVSENDWNPPTQGWVGGCGHVTIQGFCATVTQLVLTVTAKGCGMQGNIGVVYDTIFVSLVTSA